MIFLPKEVQEGLDLARKKDRRSKARLRLMAGGETYPVIDLWDDGLALEQENTEHLRGLVDLYDGTKHLYQALIIAAHEEGDKMLFDFKRVTAATDHAALDYAKRDDAPVALLPQG